MSTITFSDGESFETGGEYRLDIRGGRVYVVGEGLLSRVKDQAEGEHFIRVLKGEEPLPGAPRVTMQVVGPIAGVWTPWADVLCRICHDALGAEVTAKRKIEWPAGEKQEGDGQGFCTKCGAPIWVHEEIALLTRLDRIVGGGEMQQTGGMCAALMFPREGGRGKVVVTALDGPICIGTYAAGVWEECGEGEYVELPIYATDDDAASAIRAAIVGGQA